MVRLGTNEHDLCVLKVGMCLSQAIYSVLNESVISQIRLGEHTRYFKANKGFWSTKSFFFLVNSLIVSLASNIACWAASCFSWLVPSKGQRMLKYQSL